MTSKKSGSKKDVKKRPVKQEPRPERPPGWAVTQETFRISRGQRSPVSGSFIGTEVTAHIRSSSYHGCDHTEGWTFDVFAHTQTNSNYSSRTGGRYAIGEERSPAQARKEAERYAWMALDGKPAPGRVSELPYRDCPRCKTKRRGLPSLTISSGQTR